jgi:hypothetical protein
MFNISIDGSEPVSIGLEHLAGTDQQLSGQQIAFELTNILNEGLVTGRSLTLLRPTGGTATTLKLKRGDSQKSR